jgi:hypothetical protein
MRAGSERVRSACRAQGAPGPCRVWLGFGRRVPGRDDDIQPPVGDEVEDRKILDLAQRMMGSAAVQLGLSRFP